jgi:hypothetical protein
LLFDNGTQFIGAERELREMIQGWCKEQLKDKWSRKSDEVHHMHLKTCKTALQHASFDTI